VALESARVRLTLVTLAEANFSEAATSSAERPVGVVPSPAESERVAIAVAATLDRQHQSPCADPGYGTGFTSHGTMVMPNLGSPGPAIVQTWLTVA
jgi:hypothetical protein